MDKGRLEAFSDGVIAVIITIMVLDMKPPHGLDLHAMTTLAPVFAAYVLSFVFVGIYWNNHHHLLQGAEYVDGRALWANLFLLFWLSLVPFATAWMGETHGAAIPTATYGVVLLGSAIAFMLLLGALIACNGADSALARATGDNRKGKLSIALYVLAVAAAFYVTWISEALFVCVSLMWLVPDKRIERALASDERT